MVKVLVLRARGPAQETAARLATRGHEAVVVPLVAYRDTGAQIGEGPFDAIAFTSAAAVRALSQRMKPDSRLGALRQVPAFCVGEATARAAVDAGFGAVQSAAGTAPDLAAMLTRRFAGKGGSRNHLPRLLYPAAEDRAFDLKRALSAHGIAVEEAVIYRAELVDPGAARLAQAIESCGGGAAMLYSARMAGHLFELAARHGLKGGLAGLTFMAISENVAAMVPERGKMRVVVAERPDEAALLRLVDRLGGHDPGDDRAGKALPGTERNNAKSQ